MNRPAQCPPYAHRATLALWWVAAGLTATTSASAASDAGPAANVAPVATAAGAPVRPDTSACREHIPDGAERPQMNVRFPAQGKSGHVALLDITLSHWAQDRVLADALEVQKAADGAKAVASAGFVFPSKNSKTRPHVRRTELGERAKTRIKIPVVPLPEEPGRATLTLPSLPIALARASGQVLTLCTPAQTLVVEEPTANFADPKPRPNPAPQRQMEYWRTLHNLAYGVLVGLVVALLALFGVRWWNRRPKVVPPAPPPRPPWDVALESLRDLKHAGLLEQGRLGDYFDRVSLTLRLYLGDRYGFDGPESTTEEIRDALKARAGSDTQHAVVSLLDETDLVKFANVPPTRAQCEGVWDRTEALVLSTTPSAQGSAPKAVAPLQTNDAPKAATGGSAPGPAKPKQAPEAASDVRDGPEPGKEHDPQ